MIKEKKKKTIDVEGMTCTTCAQAVTKKLEKLGLADVQTSYASGQVTFGENDKISFDEISSAIDKLGYKVVGEENLEHEKKGLAPIEKKFWFCLFFTVPLFFHMFVPHDFFLNEPLVQISLCLPVFMIGFYHFGRSSFAALKAGVISMDVLIFIGSTAAFIYSLAGTIMYYDTPVVHDYMFFETAATIITLVLLGNVLEHRSITQTTSAIRELTSLQKTEAKKVISRNGKEEVVTIRSEEVAEGDLLLVNTGDKIPSDGIIRKHAAHIDESMITGESLPVSKKEGDEVIGGTIVTDGNLLIEATRTGNNTVLSQIIGMVKKAQDDKPDIQQLGDKVSAVFVPVVIGISTLTFLIAHFVFDVTAQQALMQSVAVLVISCPCAMGLATPTAVIAGIGRAAKNGVLIKGGSTLEELAKVKKMVFDKTGTLTTGKFIVNEISTHEGFSRKKAESIIFSLEQHSSHPIAKSLVQSLEGQTTMTSFASVKEIKGQGVEGVTKDGKTYTIRGADQQEKDGKKLILMENEKPVASIIISDLLKNNVRETIQKLNEAGIETILLSGDKQQYCDAVAAELAISSVYAEKLPDEKLQIIGEFSRETPTAMVGDGINDAPALAKADVGISIGNATQVAIQTARVVLLNEKDLKQVYLSYLISKHTLLTIKQNLFWAFFYNVVAIPIAAVGLLNPMIAALAMAFSDVVVIGNSLRLKRKRLK